MKTFKYFLCILVVTLIIGSCSEEEENRKPTCSIVTPTSRTEITKGDVVTISVEAEDQDGDLEEVRFYLDDIGIGSSLNFPYNYTWNTNETTTGSHTIRVEAIDSKQAKSEDQVTITIDGISPIADFIVSNTTISLGESVDFTDQSTNDPTSWNWDFGDGNKSTSQNPAHTYSSKGTYAVELTVSNDYGSNTETKSDYITVITTPTVITSAALSITEASAIVGGNITDDGGTSIIERGIYYGASSNPESTGIKVQIGSGSGSFSQTIEGLDENTAYYVKAYAQNSVGVAFGDPISFTTDEIITGTVIDYDGNIYNTIKIGEQWWMAENLKTTHFENGTLITLAENNIDWEDFSDIDKAMCYYNDNINNEADVYGALYTWAAAMNGAASSNSNPSGVQGVCPDGWHLPSDDEWKELEIYIGMSQEEADKEGFRGTYEGKKLKATTDWDYNGNGYDTYGLKVLPSGARIGDMYTGLHRATSFWTATKVTVNGGPYFRSLGYDISTIYRVPIQENEGCSVRCVKD